VALIPLLAKADSMTADETLAFRSFVLEECVNNKIRLFDFGQEAKERVGIPPDLVVPPFAVVASNQFDEVRVVAPSLPPSLRPSLPSFLPPCPAA
jgi:septin family protein